MSNQEPNRDKATFAGGCFWCMVAPFQEKDGVSKVIAGYTGGHKYIGWIISIGAMIRSMLSLIALVPISFGGLGPKGRPPHPSLVMLLH
jgi:hypothetical protein